LISLGSGAALYLPFSKIIGVYTRIDYRQWWQWSEKNGEYLPYYYAGDKLRGVIDEHIRADMMLSFNLDLPVRVLRFFPSEWFNQPKLRFFDVEVFFSPFLDLAMLRGPYSLLKDDEYEGTKFSLDDMISTTGLEVIVYSGLFRSLKLRGSVGYNIKKARESGIPLKWGFFPQWNEIYIGLDLYY
jgi:hypothetical protein